MMKLRFAVARHRLATLSHIYAFEFYGRFCGWIFVDPWIKIYQLDSELA